MNEPDSIMYTMVATFELGSYMKNIKESMDSKQGFQTKVWGPPAWMFLHMVTLNYDPKRKKENKRFFKSLAGVLPCGKCRENYKSIIEGKKGEELKLTDEVMETREKLARWLFKVHNQVQKDIYKKTKREIDRPKYKNTNEEFKKAMGKYEKMRAQCTKDSHGCVIPLEGRRKRAEIVIKPIKRTCTSGNSIVFT